ncbi:unnamed protein product, partial [Closterium sp. NIES-54]
KGEVPDVLIPWIRAVRLQLSERFRQDLRVLRLHSDRGGEFSSDLLRYFCRGEGILQSLVRCASAQPLAPCLLAGDLAYTALDEEGWRCVCVLGLGLSCLCSGYVRGQALRTHYSLRPGPSTSGPARRLFLRATAATAAAAIAATATAATAATTAAPLSCSYVLHRYGFSPRDSVQS